MKKKKKMADMTTTPFPPPPNTQISGQTTCQKDHLNLISFFPKPQTPKTTKPLLPPPL